MARYRSPLRTHQSKRKSWWRGWRGSLLLLLIAGGLWWVFLRSDTPEPVWTPPPLTFGLCGEKGAAKNGAKNGGRACVVDGDTLHIRRGKTAQRIRITGYDAPELDGACEAERAAALKAKRALHAWLALGNHEWDGGSEPPFDQYGRELRSIRRKTSTGEFEQLADYMLDNGLASPNGWGTFPKDWCA